MGKLIDLTGRVFGKLTVIDRNWEPRNKKGAFWNCLCECGKSIVYSGYNLKTEITNSCGCDRLPKGVTHGLSYSPEYYIWAGIKDRCRRNPNYTNKGIKICPEWENSFECFIKDVGRRPSPNHQREIMSQKM